MKKKNLLFFHASALVLDKKTVLSNVAGFTPTNPIIDIIDFIEGKDVITGEDLSRWLLLACIITPEIIDQGIKAYGKHADDIGKLVK